MADKVIAKSNLRSWLASLVASYNLIAPVAGESGPSRWKDIDGDSDVDITSDRMMMAIKEYLLPQSETLFTVSGKKGEETVVDPIKTPERGTLAMGLHLCDVRGISVLDDVYLHQGPFQDPYYAARRNSLAVMATVCSDPRWSCFCTTMGDLNDWAKAADVLVTDLDGKLYVAPISETGEKLVHGDFFAEPSAEDVAKKNEVWENLLALPKQSFAGMDTSKIVDWDDPIWAEIAQKCLGCGICSYMCPSCSCFDIQDETKGHTVERYRCRDTCQSCDFTHMGHGHNPRPEKTMRARQRVMHKFSYQVTQYGKNGCSGCGRCVESCPVNIDLREVLSRIAGK